MLSEHKIEVKLANMKGYLDRYLEAKDIEEDKLHKEDLASVKFVQGYIVALKHVLSKTVEENEGATYTTQFIL